MSDEEKTIEEASTKFQTDTNKVRTFLDATLAHEAFVAGIDWRDSNPSKGVQELIGALEAIRIGLTTQQTRVERMTKDRAHAALLEYQMCGKR